MRGMVRHHPVAMAAAEARMGRLVTFSIYKADWRGHLVQRVNRRFCGSQTWCACSECRR